MRDRMVARELSTATSETEPFLSAPRRRSTSLSRSALATAGSASVSMIGCQAAVRGAMIDYNTTADLDFDRAASRGRARIRIEASSAAAYGSDYGDRPTKQRHRGRSG